MSESQALSNDVEDDWETQYILLDIQHGNVDPGLLNSLHGDYKILGLDTDSPYLQLDKAIFKGEYTESFGSDMIFAKTASSGGGGEHVITGDSKSPTARLECITTTRISLSRAFIVPKEGQNGSQAVHPEDQ